MPHYSTTLTTAGDFTDQNMLDIESWYDSFAVSVMVIELHKDGTRHVHGIHEDACKRAQNVTRKLQGLYKKMGVPVKYKSIEVKTSGNVEGWLSYLGKEMSDLNPPKICKGWTMESIIKRAKENLKSIPDSLLMEDWRILNEAIAASAMLKYAKNAHMPMNDKYTFADVYASMKADKYVFGRVRLGGVYSSCMAVLGDKSMAVEEALMALNDFPR